MPDAVRTTVEDGRRLSKSDESVRIVVEQAESIMSDRTDHLGGSKDESNVQLPTTALAEAVLNSSSRSADTRPRRYGSMTFFR